MTTDKVWIFYLQDGVCGGIIFADSKEDAFKKLAVDRGTTIEQMKPFTSIVSLTELNEKDVYDLW